jgi:hypothetical protein
MARIGALDDLRVKIESRLLPDENDCWIWQGAIGSGGRYGNVWWDGKSRPTHRAYLQTLGVDVEGLVVDHLCRVTLCCNPEHLEPVTQKVNVERGDLVKWREGRTHCDRGHVLAADNIYTRPSDGYKFCRGCMRLHYEKRVA